MDYKRIDELLKKYWDAETTLEEEQELFRFFEAGDVPGHLEETARIFSYFAQQKSPVISNASFEKEILDKTSIAPIAKKTKVIRWNFNQALKVAAAIGGVVVASVIIRNQLVTQETPDTFEDPKAAYEETKKAFELLADKWNKGKEEAMKIRTINEAQEIVKE